MWPFGAKRSARREEIRRSRSERLGSWYRRLGGLDTVGWAAIVVPMALLVAVIVNLGVDGLPHRVGEWTPRALTARVPLQIEDELQTNQARIRARDTSPNYYSLDVTIIDDLRGRLMNALTLARASGGDRELVRSRAADDKVQLDDAALDELLRIAATDDSAAYHQVVDAILQNLRKRGLVTPDNAGIGRATPTAFLLDPEAPQERNVPMSRLVFANDADGVQRMLAEVSAGAPAALQPSLRSSLAAILRVEGDENRYRPLYRFDARTIEIADQAALAEPKQYVRYAAGDVIADRGLISAEELNILRREHAEYMNSLTSGSPWKYESLSVWISRGFLAALIIAGVATYVSRFSARRMRQARLLPVVSLLLVVIAVIRLTAVMNIAPQVVVVAFVAIAAALLTLMRPYATVFVVSTGLAVIAVLSVRGGVGLLIVLLTVAGVFSFGLREVRNRGRIVFVGLGAGCAAFLTHYAVLTIGGQTPMFALRDGLWAAGAALAAAFVVEGLLPWLERLFGFATGMTLLEWCDASKPLQRMMAAEAPGTYNHSLLVGTLSEAACEAIGANGLLARAGAYYHDIGKIPKSEYFVENQSLGVSRHDRLSPAMSHLIIVGHVKDGVEMAREYSLPEVLHPFIAEHHGTTVVEYFYHAAKGQRKSDDPEVSDVQFRYPGPKPQSRETAILMLADGVEGAVRAMSEPTPNRIEAVVSEIIRKRLIDRQFDACDLTFRELAIIEAALVKSLCSIYHARIVYPSSTGEPPRAEQRAS